MFIENALPAIRPVNFALRDDTIVIRPVSGSEPATAVRNTVVAFEADQFSAELQTGWSVSALGHAKHVRDRAELDKLAVLHFRPWNPVDAELHITISIKLLTGRRSPQPRATRQRPWSRVAW